MQQNPLIRYMIMLTVLGTHSAVCETLSQYAYHSVVESVKLGAKAVLGAALCVWLYSLVWTIPTSDRPPAMTLSNICVYIYGLGLFLFVAVYCLLGTDINSTTWLMVGMTGMAVDDVIILHREGRCRRIAWLGCMCMCVGAFCMFVLDSANMIVFNQAVDTGNMFVIFCGIIMPLACPFMFHSVRVPPSRGCMQHCAKRVGCGMIADIIQYGASYACILAAVVGPSLHAGELHSIKQGVAQWVNSSASDWINGTGATSVNVHALAGNMTTVAAAVSLPVTTTLTVFLAVQCILLYKTVEFVSAATLVFSVRHMLHNPTLKSSAAGVAFGVCAVLIYLASVRETRDASPEKTTAIDYDMDADEEDAVLQGFPSASHAINGEDA